MLRFYPLLFLTVLAAAAELPEQVDFNRDIRPILSDKCFACHGPDEGKRSTALRFDQRESAFIDLASGGRSIVPGDPAASKLLERIKSEDPVLRMPPAYQGHAKLSDDEIAVIERWIEQGAEWQGHWAFLRAERPRVPALEMSLSVRNPIDWFVIRRLDREGLSASPPADKRSLIRRLSLDLTGLPPTPAEVDAFLVDSSPKAYENVVDRLLASPRYGERMALDWLDAARYADTNGYQNDQERDMWRWRDWVIAAFNDNKPFDEFTVEQIAGDLLPDPTLAQLIATGFNRNHRGNGELGIVPEEYAVEYVVDRVDTTATVFLGLTMGCARCHDHKYDPISQKDFYRFYAFFNNVPDRGRYFKYGNTPPFVHAPTDDQQAELDALEAEIEELHGAFLSETARLDKAVETWDAAGSTYSFNQRLILETLDAGPERFDGERVDDYGDEINFSFWDRYTLAAGIKPEQPTGGIWGRYKPSATARGNRGFGLFLVDGKLQLRMESTDIDDRMIVETVESIPLERWSHVAATYDGSRLTKGMAIYIDGKPAKLKTIIDHSNNDTQDMSVPLRLGHGPMRDGRFVGWMQDARIYDRALSPDEAAVVAVDETPGQIAGMPKDRRSAAQQAKLRLAYLAEAAHPFTRQAWKGLQELRLEREELIDSLPTVMVMQESETPRPTYLLNRGAYDAPGERVEAAFPAALAAGAGPSPTRLDLARWLVSRDNPLTARVFVNRLWQSLFGRGIVKTVEDFGSQGEWPTHPDLLDWLAVEFMESGWNVKGLVKTIVMSGTYRQSSDMPAALADRDPDNVLLARGPRVRLGAEAIRDQALYAAGLLGGEIGGPSVKPYQPAGLWKELSNAGAYQHDKGEKLYRRSLYTYWKRTIGPPAMLTFDSAARETCVVRQTRTNTPLQALNLMNDVTYAEASRVIAERMLREGGDGADARLAYGFELATAREPRPAEARILENSLNRFLDRYQTAPEDAEQLVSVGESPLDPELDVRELAAYTTVASLILNLDETITKD